MSAIQPCIIGSTLNEECHMLTLSRRVGFYSIADLSQDQKLIIEWRSKIKLYEENTLCYHPEKNTYLA